MGFRSGLWRQEEEMRARGLDRLSGLCALVAGKIVEDDDAAWPERWNELGLNPSLEAFTVDGSIKH